jgi:Flp pilus assembly protein TadG
MSRYAVLKPRRSGTTVVETAVVIGMFLMLLFGIFEYARLLYTRQLVTNAAREGARYAVCHTYDSTVVADTQKLVKTYLGGMDTMPNYKCLVYQADTAGNNIGAATDTQFGVYIAVEISLTYTPLTPSFLHLNSTMTISSKCCMGSEAN